MLRMSKLADYGTVVMVYLAKNADTICNARDIAAHTRLTIPMVSKILKRLTTQKLLVSVRGVAGGYRLQRPAKDISVSQIIFALEDQKGLTECSVHSQGCSLQDVCHVKGNWRLINAAIETALDSVSLEALAKPVIHQEALERVKMLASGVKRD